MTVLITGGTGFVGSYLSVGLRKRNETLIIFDAFPDLNLLGDIARSIEIVKGDLLDRESFERTVQRCKPEVIIHLAAYRNTDSQQKPMGAFKLNCEGMMNVLETARSFKVGRVVYASSVAVYGPPDYYRKMGLDPFLVTEDFPPKPSNVYGVTKLFNEEIAKQYQGIYGLQTIGLRFPIIYGPGKKLGSKSSVFNDVIEGPLKGESVTINSYKDQVFNFLYVKDASYALTRAIYAPSPRHSLFNVGGTRCRIKDLLRSVMEMIPGAKVNLTPTDHEGTSSSGVDSTLAKEELGYEAQFDLKDSIADYQKHLRESSLNRRN